MGRTVRSCRASVRARYRGQGMSKRHFALGLATLAALGWPSSCGGGKGGGREVSGGGRGSSGDGGKDPFGNASGSGGLNAGKSEGGVSFNDATIPPMNAGDCGNCCYESATGA